MDDSEQPTKKRKFSWDKAYSKIPKKEVQKRIGVTLQRLASTAITVEDMLERAGYHTEEKQKYEVTATKDEVYKQIIRYLTVEGYLVDPKMEANITDLVLFIISPIIEDFIHKTGQDTVRLAREKKIISVDTKTGGYEEFVVVDGISVTEERYILIC